MPTLHSNAEPLPLAKRLETYGCTEIIRLDEKLSTPEQLDYLDLLPTRSNQITTLAAVAEHQGTALLYVVDACDLSAKNDAASISATRKRLANRSDPAWLAVARAGSLEIFPIGFHDETDMRPVEVINERSETAPYFFQSLVHGTFQENSRSRGTDYVYRKIFDLLMQTTNAFVPQDGSGKIDSLEILSMAGRALFFRFLIDRHIVLDKELSGDGGICPSATELKDAFSSARKAAQTSAWLDATFNGDFLPLIDESIPHDDRESREKAYLKFFSQTERLVGSSIFLHLHAILRGWRAIGDSFQTEIDWGDLDFAHIPVGVLSQVYESFSHRADPRTARDTSVHYTPRTIARLMVDEAFAAVQDPKSAKVLDASCGAGIFLVLAFRRLVQERWRDSDRPDTTAIQEILYGQLRGFDISESALRLAALALYITAIEVNASPRPPAALKFPRNLRGSVLHRFGSDEHAESLSSSFPLGSLGDQVPREFDGSFDIVIGNPPWTRLRDPVDANESDQAADSGDSETTKLNAAFTEIARRVLSTRGFEKLASTYENPDKNPDLPFLWRAMEWARHDGVIAFAMPARLFGRTTGKGFEAWRSILQSLEITGLVNGSDLRWSSVWKDVKVPFCILFAKNKTPNEDHAFYFATPINEPEQNGEGRFRIDYEATCPVEIARVQQQPWLLKTLALGTALDVELMTAIKASRFDTLRHVWDEWDDSGDKTGKGYDRTLNDRQKDAEYLSNLLDFEPVPGSFEIPFGKLITYYEKYHRRTAYWPKTKDLWQPPLVIIPQSPGREPKSPRAYLSRRRLAFSQSYYGYSCAGHPEALTLASLLYLLPHSTLFDYFCLMTSRRGGFDRQTFNKEEFDALPFPDVTLLPKKTRTNICLLAERFRLDSPKPWEEMNALIFALYHLNDDAVQVATDTLFSAASYRIAGKDALEGTTIDNRKPFVLTLQSMLEPYFDVCDEHVAVRDMSATMHCDEPWQFVSISRSTEAVDISANLLRKAMKAANQKGCSRILVRAPRKAGLILGLLNQRRWWTPTRARLCAMHIIRDHLDAFHLTEHL
jgi:hypothetical protein